MQISAGKKIEYRMYFVKNKQEKYMIMPFTAPLQQRRGPPSHLLLPYAYLGEGDWGMGMLFHINFQKSI